MSALTPLFLMIAMQAIPSSPDGQPLLSPLPDWDAMMPLAFRQAPVVTPPMARFVAEEVSSGRCVVPTPQDRRYSVRIDVAVLVSPEGAVRAAVPHAIQCPTVEQYGAGLVIGFARNNVSVLPGAKANTWYRATLAFDWTE